MHGRYHALFLAFGGAGPILLSSTAPPCKASLMDAVEFRPVLGTVVGPYGRFECHGAAKMCIVAEVAVYSTVVSMLPFWSYAAGSQQVAERISALWI